jgi:hypothetical protein
MIRFDLADGRIAFGADPADTDVLRSLIDQFTGLLAVDGDALTVPDPALRRLLPDPMPDDPVESAELRALTQPALIGHKRENAARVAASLAAPGGLDARDELAWLQWLTDIRLVLATRLDILVDGDEGASATEADKAMQWTYQALGAVQSDLIDALDERDALGQPA